MEKKEFLPLGSVIVINGSIKKFMIIARGLNVKNGDKTRYFDYGGCYYPEGVIGDSMMYFNHKDIMKVLAQGYDDDDNKIMVENINNALASMNKERSDITQSNAEKEQENVV